MKNLILTTALMTVMGVTYGQSLQKGNLIGVHNLTVNLDPDVTMNQYKEFFANKVQAEWEKHFTGVKVFLLEGVRGEGENGLGIVWVFETEGDRDKYFNDDGSNTELGTATFEKLQPVTEEWQKLGTWTSTYTDWVVQ